MNQYVPYLRVSTSRQGIEGLGIEAQEFSISNYLKRVGGEPLAEFREVETGKSRDTHRPELAKAIALCRQTGATLLIAKLDRLARNAAFVLSLRDSGVEFVACDNPEANRLVIGILAVVAEHEAAQISERTRNALAAAKRRGTKLGNPRPAASLARGRLTQSLASRAWREKIRPAVEEIRQAGITTLGGIARALNARGLQTVTGKSFLPQTVKLALAPIAI